MNNWTEIAETLHEKMAEKEPEIHLRDVMNWFDLASPSTADYYLWRLYEMGIVKRIAGKWFLAW